MGYYTEFTPDAHLRITPPLKPRDLAALEKFIWHTYHGDESLWGSFTWMVSRTRLVPWPDHGKYYGWKEWIRYLIRVWFEPNGYKINGRVWFLGDVDTDAGYFCVDDNVVTIDPMSSKEIRNDFLYQIRVRQRGEKPQYVNSR